MLFDSRTDVERVVKLLLTRLAELDDRVEPADDDSCDAVLGWTADQLRAADDAYELTVTATPPGPRTVRPRVPARLELRLTVRADPPAAPEPAEPTEPTEPTQEGP